MLKRRGFKLVAAVLVLLMMMSVVLAGCSGKESESRDSKGTEQKSDNKSKGSEPYEFTFVLAQYSNATEPFGKKLIENFEKENPDIKVDLQVVGWDVLEQKVNTMVSTNQAPEILNLDQYSRFVDDDLLYKIEDVISDDLKGKLYESFYNGAKIDDVAYTIPLLASARSLYYNKEIFEQAGIAEPPKTWNELVEVAKTIKEKTGIDGFGIPMTSFEGQAYFSYFIWGNGGDWKKDGKWTINSEENIEAIEFMKELVNKHKVTNPQPTAINRDELQKVFGAGKLGMMITANFLPVILKTEAPDLQYEVAPIPVNEGKAPATLGVQDFVMVFKTAENPEAVGKFLDFFYRDDNYEEFITNEGMLPATVPVGDSMVEKDPFTARFVKMLPTAKFYPLTDPKYAEMRQEVIKAVQEVLIGDKSAAEALGAVQKKAES